MVMTAVREVATMAQFVWYTAYMQESHYCHGDAGMQLF
jgi:hypothetical protein